MHYVFFIYIIQIIFLLHNTIVSCWLLSISPALNMLCMLLLSISLFKLIHEVYPPVASMEMLNSSTIRLVTSVEFSKVPSSSTLTGLHGWFLFFGFSSMNEIILTGFCLDTLVNIQIVILFAHTTVKMVVKPQMEVTL